VDEGAEAEADTAALGGFADRCQWQQDSANSAFVRKRVCTRATQSGRITLAGNTLKCVEGETVEIAIEEGKYAAVLTEHFGMTMGNPTGIRPNHD
jgi:N-hydroxyarylamine O-acetyltransferase